jgi:hypothetical protein
VYNAVRSKGLVELQRDILLCPACEPSAATLYGELPAQARMLALLFCKIPVRDMPPLVMGLRQLKGYSARA